MGLIHRYVPILAILLFLSLNLKSSAQPIFDSRVVYEPPKPPATQPSTPVNELITRLSAESSDDREAAESALFEMGPNILPQLQWALEREEKAFGPSSKTAMPLPPKSSFHELGVVIDRLERVRQSRGSIITLHEHNAPLSDVLTNLGRQIEAGVSIESVYEKADWVLDARATVDIERGSFWDALRTLDRDIGLKPAHAPGIERLGLTRQPGRANRLEPLAANNSVVSGPLLIVPFSVELWQRANYFDRGQSTGMTLTLQAFAEPKVVRAGRHAMVRIDECIDEQDFSLLLPDTKNFQSTDIRDLETWKVPVQLAAPRSGNRIKLIKGQFSIGVGPETRNIVLSDLPHARGTSLHFDGWTVTEKFAEPYGRGYWVLLEIAAPADRPPMVGALTRSSFWIRDQAYQTILTDFSFTDIQRNERSNATNLSLRTWASPPIPATLDWVTPSETRWLTVQFELRDLRIPLNK